MRARSLTTTNFMINMVEMPLIVSTTAADYKFEGSYASLYATLALFAISFPGIISLVTRSTKVKVDQKSYVLPGPNVPSGKALRQVAAEIMAYFQANNYKVDTAGETIIFKGVVERSKSQAFFLSFCLFGGLAGLALVMSIQLPVLGPLEIGNWYFLMCLASPVGGLYYWQNAKGDEEVRVRLQTTDGDLQTEVTVQASKEELERFSAVMDYDEKGKVMLSFSRLEQLLFVAYHEMRAVRADSNSRYFRSQERMRNTDQASFFSNKRHLKSSKIAIHSTESSILLRTLRKYLRS
jgi:hypothetical protein